MSKWRTITKLSLIVTSNISAVNQSARNQLPLGVPMANNNQTDNDCIWRNVFCFFGQYCLICAFARKPLFTTGLRVTCVNQEPSNFPKSYIRHEMYDIYHISLKTINTVILQIFSTEFEILSFSQHVNNWHVWFPTNSRCQENIWNVFSIHAFIPSGTACNRFPWCLWWSEGGRGRKT